MQVGPPDGQLTGPPPPPGLPDTDETVIHLIIGECR